MLSLIEMKKIKCCLSIVVIAGACFGVYKSYKAYNSNLCEADLMLSENVLALSEDHASEKLICWNTVYKLVKTHKCWVWEENEEGELVKVGEWANFKINERYWQTCAVTSNPKFNQDCRPGVCRTEACACQDGYETQRPSSDLEGDRYIAF